MTQTFILFLIINIISITVDITISKLILLLLITISTLLTYKWYKRTQPNDKLIVYPLKQIQSLVPVEIFAKFMGLMFMNQQSKKDYFIFTTLAIVSIFIANHFSMRTLCVMFVDLIIILQLRRNYIQQNHKNLKAKLKIKHTNSFEYTPGLPKPKAFTRKNEVPHFIASSK